MKLDNRAVPNPLSNVLWGDFKVSELFDVQYGINMELNACFETTKDDPEAIAFVARTAENNGVTAFVKPVEGKIPQPADIITVAGGGSVLSTFLQVRPFYSGRDLYLLIPKNEISKCAKLFIVTVLQSEKYRFSYGRQANKSLRDLNLHLPVTADGKPDWEWMDNYIKSLHCKPIKTSCKNPMSLDTSPIRNWGEFLVKDIFYIYNGSGITREEVEEHRGSFPAVQSGEENRGILGYMDLNYAKSQGYCYSEDACLTVARSGTAGCTNFFGSGCIVGDSAKILKLKSEHSQYIYLFMQTVLEKLRYKYSYGRKVTENKYQKEKIRLPITATGDPDWRFMENYMKSLPYADLLNKTEVENGTA